MRTFKIEVDGKTYGGKVDGPSAAGDRKPPVIVAVHGGSYSSGYFDVPGYSLMTRAAARGLPIVAIDRPGYGESTGLIGTDDHIEANAKVLLEVIPAILATLELDDLPLFIIGHSIGAAITLNLAAIAPDGYLSGIAVSGVGAQTRDEARASFGGFERESLIALPDPIKDTVMFGGPDFIAADMPAASYVAGAPAPAAELVDINTKWHLRLPSIAPRVSVPIHYRHAGQDALWNDLNVDNFAALFSNSPHIDAAQISGAGHCMDFHTVGARLQEEQLNFAEEAIHAHAEANGLGAGG